MPWVGNRWRKLNYTLMAPVYDWLVGPLMRMRRRAVEIADVKEGERVLIVGVGTGADLPLLSSGALVVGVDLTPAMMERARGQGARLALMDGTRLAFADSVFDVVLLHLIVAVIPDPLMCLREAERVLRPGGRAVVWDKFAPDAGAGWALRLARPISMVLGTDVTIRLGELVGLTGLRMTACEGGLYRIARLEKEHESLLREPR